MKKLLILFLMLIFTSGVNAKSIKGELNSLISNSDIPKSSVSVSIKNLNTGKTIYEHNEKILMHPASVQKILTLPAIMETLGDDYEFTTSIFSRGNDGYLIKLGADPYFSYSDLKGLVREIDTKTIKQIYIDDSIIENKDWGEGWQWDDNLNILMPKFNSYNMDKNLLKITVVPQNGQTMIINASKYPIAFFNDVSIGDINNVKVSRDSSISSDALTISGTVCKPCTIIIPSNNLKRYFNVKLTQALEDRNIYLKNSNIVTKQNSSDNLITSVKHPIERGEYDILKNSNNMVIETASKLAAQKAFQETGTDINAIKLFNSYFEKLGLDYSEIKIVDASGVSKNNLVNTDFVTEYLVKSKDNITLEKMAKPSEGTLSERLIPIKENLKAKTGTLSDISSIAGYLTSKTGKKYAFCIIINDPKTTNSEKKNLEDYILRELYLEG